MSVERRGAPTWIAQNSLRARPLAGVAGAAVGARAAILFCSARGRGALLRAQCTAEPRVDDKNQAEQDSTRHSGYKKLVYSSGNKNSYIVSDSLTSSIYLPLNMELRKVESFIETHNGHYFETRLWPTSEQASKQAYPQIQLLSTSVSQSVSYFTVPPRAHPSTGSQSGSATPGQTQVPSTRSRGLLNCRK